jgi:hypothetical protein
MCVRSHSVNAPRLSRRRPQTWGLCHACKTAATPLNLVGKVRTSRRVSQILSTTRHRRMVRSRASTGQPREASAKDSASADQECALLRPVDRTRDHVRGGNAASGTVCVVVFGDYLCPYCRRLRFVVSRLRQVLSACLTYVFRHFPNEAAHPGANLMARISEAAANQRSVLGDA